LDLQRFLIRTARPGDRVFAFYNAIARVARKFLIAIGWVVLKFQIAIVIAIEKF
jgi:hypothetical protein